MAFGTPTLVGKAGFRDGASPATTIVLTIGTTVATGDVVFVQSTWDNAGTSTAETSQLSIADTQGHTWTLIREQTYTQGVVADGICTAAWYSVLTNDLEVGDTITVTSTSAQVANVINAIKVAKDDPGVTLDDLSASTTFTFGARDRSLSGLASEEHLFVGFFAAEKGHNHLDPVTGSPSHAADQFPQHRTDWDTSSYGAQEDADYTSLGPVGSTPTGSSSSAANVSQRMSVRIATATGDTWSLGDTLSGSEKMMFLAAFSESGTGPTSFGSATIDLGIDHVFTGDLSEVSGSAAVTVGIDHAFGGAVVDPNPRSNVWDGDSWE